MNDTPAPQFLTVTEAAQRLGLDESTIRRHIHSGLFPGTVRTSPRRGSFRIPIDAIVKFEKARQQV